MELMLAETAADIEMLTPLVNRWADSCCEDQHGLPVTSAESMLEILKEIVASGGCVVVLTGMDRIIGVMAAIQRGRVLVERFLYMVNFQFMPRLVKGMKKLGHARGCKTLLFTSTNIAADKRERVEKLFFAHGVREYSRTYTVECG